MARLSMGALEARVMDVLWDRHEWLTPGQVHAVVAAERPLAYTTVMTILSRLHTKGRVDRRRAGRAYAYRPVDTKAAWAASRMRDVLAGAGDRAAALGHFVETMPAKERAALRRLLGVAE